MEMDWSIILTALAGGFTTIVGCIASYFATKKKYNVEVRGLEIDNLKSIIEILAELIRSLSQSLTLVLERNKQLEQEILELRRQMFNLMGSICYDFTCVNRRALREHRPEHQEPREDFTPRDFEPHEH